MRKHEAAAVAAAAAAEQPPSISDVTGDISVASMIQGPGLGQVITTGGTAALIGVGASVKQQAGEYE